MSAHAFPAPPAPLSGSTRSEEDAYIWASFRHYSRTFSLASHLLPRAIRLPIATLYLYCRTADNLADERAPLIGRIQAMRDLETMRESLTASLAGHPPNSLVWRRLSEIHQEFGLVTRPLFELLDGVEWDLQNRPVRSVDELMRYSDLVAGSVGAMMLPFLVSARSDIERLTPPARALGNAMQITNILRDVGEDLQTLGRVYLPEDLLHHYDVGLRELEAAANGQPHSTSYKALVEEVMTLAEKLYEDAEPGLAELPIWSRLGISAAARMYREILNEVRASGYDNLRQRNVVDLPRKLRLLAHDDYGRRKARLVDPSLSAA